MNKNVITRCLIQIVLRSFFSDSLCARLDVEMTDWCVRSSTMMISVDHRVTVVDDASCDRHRLSRHFTSPRYRRRATAVHHVHRLRNAACPRRYRREAAARTGAKALVLVVEDGRPRSHVAALCRRRLASGPRVRHVSLLGVGDDSSSGLAAQTRRQRAAAHRAGPL